MATLYVAIRTPIRAKQPRIRNSCQKKSKILFTVFEIFGKSQRNFRLFFKYLENGKKMLTFYDKNP